MYKLGFFILIIAILAGCHNTSDILNKLPQKWVEVSETDSGFVYCQDIPPLYVSLGKNEIILNGGMIGETTYKILDSHKNNDTITFGVHIIIKEDTKESEVPGEIKMYWLDKSKEVAIWKFSNWNNVDFTFVTEEKLTQFPKVECEEATDVATTTMPLGDIKSEVSNIKEFASGGWNIIDTAYGDLNKDGQEDVVLILEKNDPKNMVVQPEGSLGVDSLNLNPRRLVVAFKDGGKYKLAAHNDHLLPLANDEDQTCLVDPLSEGGGLKISNGVLNLSLHYWYSCGSWYVTDNTYVFRFQNNKFELIGYSTSSFHRASGEMTSDNINYSTKKKQTTTGGNMFDESVNHPKDTWVKIEINHLYDLQEITADTKLIGL